MHLQVAVFPFSCSGCPRNCESVYPTETLRLCLHSWGPQPSFSPSSSCECFNPSVDVPAKDAPQILMAIAKLILASCSVSHVASRQGLFPASTLWCFLGGFGQKAFRAALSPRALTEWLLMVLQSIQRNKKQAVNWVCVTLQTGAVT